MTPRTKLTVLRRWDNPEIELSISHHDISMAIDLEDFLDCLGDEVIEHLVTRIGNPTLMVTKAQLRTAIEAGVHDALVEASHTVIKEVKKRSVEIV